MSEGRRATSSRPPTQQGPQVLLSSAGRGWGGLDAEFVHVPRGKARAPGGGRHLLGMHFGRPVRADCAVGDRRAQGLQRPGDVDFVPAGVEGSWEDHADCHVLRLSLDPSLLAGVAADLRAGRGAADVAPLLRVRDARLEALLHAVKADLEASTPSDPLYIDHLASALAIRLIEIAADRGPDVGDVRTVEARKLARVIDVIEANLARKLRLDDLAKAAGLSATQLKTAFRNGTGMPVHRYVIRRRVEHARDLITTTGMPASEVALAAGFAHQSHMTTTMHRVLGCTPGSLPRPARTIGPILQKIGPNVSE